MNILFLDVETSPNVGHVWGLYKQTISLSQLMESSYTLCFSAKWYGDRNIIFKTCHDPTMLNDLWELLNKADMVVHYNGKKFDIPTINKELALGGYEPPDPYRQLDLLLIARKRFKFPSNKLDYVAQAFGIGKKHPHIGHELWVGCMNDEPWAWTMMEKYNKQDVRLLEKLYKVMLPWIDNHPNRALYMEELEVPVCPNCGSKRIKKNGYSATKFYIYQRYRCTSCNTPLRGRFQVSAVDKNNILTQETQNA